MFTTAKIKEIKSESKSEAKSTMKSRMVCLQVKFPRNFINKFYNLTAKEKIDILCESMAGTCEEWVKTEPLSLWKISWQEFGIKPLFADALSTDDVNHMHKKFSALVQKYPQLTIEAGTVRVDRPLAQCEKEAETLEQKAQKILGYYQLHPHETIYGATSDYNKEQKKIKEALQDEKKEDTLKHVIVRSNTAYVYTIDAKALEKMPKDQKEFPVRIIKHRKTSPCEETSANSYCFFKPASLKTYNPIFEIYDIHTKQMIPIGLEICLEHRMGTVKAKKVEPFLQLVVSATVELKTGNAVGKNLLQFDSEVPIRLYKNGFINNGTEVAVYETMVTDNGFAPIIKVYDVDLHVFAFRDFLKQQFQEYTDALNFVEILSNCAEKDKVDFDAKHGLLQLVQTALKSDAVTDEVLDEYKLELEENRAWIFDFQSELNAENLDMDINRKIEKLNERLLSEKRRFQMMKTKLDFDEGDKIRNYFVHQLGNFLKLLNDKTHEDEKSLELLSLLSSSP